MNNQILAIVMISLLSTYIFFKVNKGNNTNDNMSCGHPAGTPPSAPVLYNKNNASKDGLTPLSDNFYLKNDSLQSNDNIWHTMSPRMILKNNNMNCQARKNTSQFPSGTRNLIAESHANVNDNFMLSNDFTIPKNEYSFHTQPTQQKDCLSNKIKKTCSTCVDTNQVYNFHK